MQNLECKIVGTGLIASAFRRTTFRRPTLIFAAGVSNSRESRESEFRREFELVRAAILSNQDKTVLYFSTASLASGFESPYTAHKDRIEKLISNEASSYFIFRLPQVVGVVNNSTLISFLTRRIMAGERLSIELYAKRSLIDVEDVVRISNYISDGKISERSIHVIAPHRSTYVHDIVEQICSILNVQANCDYIEAGEDQEFNVDYLREVIGSDDAIFRYDYWRDVLRRYVPQYLIMTRGAVVRSDVA